MNRYPVGVQLHKIAALGHLDADVLDALTKVARVHALRPGDVLLYQGDEIKSFYAVQYGGLRLVDYTTDGESVALKIYGPGDVFGLLAISGSYPHPTQIEAIHESLVVAIDGHDARQLILEYPPLALAVIDLLTAHVHHGHQRIRNMACKRVDRRLAQFLLQLCDKFGRQEAERILIDVPITQRDLAEFTNTTVETVNRTLSLWSKQGLLAVAHKRIDILDYATLQNIADNQYIDQVNLA